MIVTSSNLATNPLVERSKSTGPTEYLDDRDSIEKYASLAIGDRRAG